MRIAMHVAAAFALTLLAGCGRDDDLNPPQLIYGQTECELCRMIISEEPHAAAAAIVTAEGVRKPGFDDIGCLIRYLQEVPPDTRIVAYVHDYESRKWLDAAQAVFVFSETLRTPMAWNLAACESPAAADALLTRYPGKTTSFAALQAEAAASKRSKP